MIQAHTQISNRHHPRSRRAFALAIGVMAGGVLLGASIVWPVFAWARWTSLLPLYLVVRRSSPRAAFVCGAVWGGGICATLLVSGEPLFAANPHFSLLLVLVSATYAWLASLITRRIGFSPFLLAVTWIGVELVLSTFHLPISHGLLAHTLASSGTLLMRIGRLFGYVAVAFLVAYANALLLSVALVIHVRLPSWAQVLVAFDTVTGWRVPQTPRRLESGDALANLLARAPPRPA